MTLGKSIKGLAGIAALASLSLLPGKAAAQTPLAPVPVYGVSAPSSQHPLPDTMYLGELVPGQNFTVPTWKQFDEFIFVEPNGEYEITMRGAQPTTDMASFPHRSNLGGVQHRSAETYSLNDIIGLTTERDPAMYIADVDVTRTRVNCETDCISTQTSRFLVPNPARVVVMERVIKETPSPNPLPEMPAIIPPPPPVVEQPPVVAPPPPVPIPPKESWSKGFLAAGGMAALGGGGDNRWCPPCEENGSPGYIATRGHEFRGYGGWAMGEFRNPIISVAGLGEFAKGDYQLVGEDCDITDPGATYSRVEGAGVLGVLGSDDVRFGPGLGGHRMAINRTEPLGNRSDLEQGYSIRAGAFNENVTGSIGYGKYGFRSDLTGADWDGSALDARVDANLQLSDRVSLYLMGSGARLDADGMVRGTTVTDDGQFSFTAGEDVSVRGYRLSGEALVGFGITDNLQLAVGVGGYMRELGTGDDRYTNDMSMVVPRVGVRINF